MGAPSRQQNPYVRDTADEGLLQEFIAKFSLNMEAETQLRSLDFSTQQKVLREFAPRDTSRDCNPIFWKFVQGLSPAAKGKGGKGGARRKLTVTIPTRGLPKDAQFRVLTEFRPRDASTDVNNIFMKFAQSLAKGEGKGGKWSKPY